MDVVANLDEFRSGRADVWSSGRVDSAQSLNVGYGGPALKPSTRYHWRVTVWGADGKPYAASEPAWFETGLMKQDAWKAQWIGYETTEEAAVRQAPAEWIVSPDAAALGKEKSSPEQFAYRTVIHVDKAVKAAALFATAEDTAAAWINGEQVLDAAPFPAWRQMPWKKFVRADVTGKLKSGDNTLALESVRYTGSPFAPPAIATLYVEYADGSTATFNTSSDWKTAIHAPAGWQQPGFDDASWKTAMIWKPGGDSGASHPWIPDSVKVLRHAFNVISPIKSARIYSTALGEYELFLNGRRVSEDYFAPGWTDYRERVVYQTYDVTRLLVEGRNAIGALLAPGWYETPLEWFQQPNNYGDTPPALRAQIRIEHADGTVEWINTDATWQAERSFIRHSELYDGETQDARTAQLGWNTPEFDASRLEAGEDDRTEAGGDRGAGLPAGSGGTRGSCPIHNGASARRLHIRFRAEPCGDRAAVGVRRGGNGCTRSLRRNPEL